MILKLVLSVEINNIISTGNTAGVGNSGFNGQFVVSGISSTKQFSVGLNTDPGTFDTNTSTRTTSFHSLDVRNMLTHIILTDYPKHKNMFLVNKMVFTT